MATKSTKPKNALPKTPKLTAQDRQWQAESDARTLMEAEKIKADRVRLGAAKAHAVRQVKVMTKIGKM
jgi:hypothetical protein